MPSAAVLAACLASSDVGLCVGGLCQMVRFALKSSTAASDDLRALRACLVLAGRSLPTLPRRRLEIAQFSTHTSASATEQTCCRFLQTLDQRLATGCPLRN